MIERKTVSSLLPQEKYAYYKNHYVPTSNEVLLQKEYLKGGKKSYHISYPGSKTSMFIAKNYKVDSAEFAYFLIKTKLAVLGELLPKILFRT